MPSLKILENVFFLFVLFNVNDTNTACGNTTMLDLYSENPNFVLPLKEMKTP